MPAQVRLGSPPSALDAPLRSLTERERDVLALVAEGHSNVGISEHLGVAIRTVETHTSRIFMKLDLADGAGVHRRVLAALAHVRATQEA
jgi:DNA-binding NarL/FixJ family response regulator